MNDETDERSEAFERGLKTMERVALELYQRGRALAVEELEEARLRNSDLRSMLEQVTRERDEWRDKFHALNQTAGELCDTCGWAFKLPGEQCRCEVVRERDEARAKLNAEYLRHADAFRLAMEQIEHWQRRAEHAFDRGAKAMREACAARIGSDPALLVSLRSHCESALRALPIPEEP